MSVVTRIAALASNSLTKPLNVEEVFSTFLYEGNGSARSITNSIDLSGEGGLTWIKIRDGFNSPLGHHLYDTARGATKKLRSDNTEAESTVSTGLTAFNSNGFSLGSNVGVNGSGTGDSYVSWTFRKAPKFFDIQTWTGDGTVRTISHNLDSVPGMIIVKRTSGTSDWRIYHRGVNAGSSPQNYSLKLNDTSAQGFGALWNTEAPTSTHFKVANDTDTNASGSTYVAYIFAHNNSDGGFGNGSQDIIKCGNYTGNAGSQSINLGFEPQWLFVKNTSSSVEWLIFDNMRGWGGSRNVTPVPYLQPNASNDEADGSQWLAITPTGFNLTNVSVSQVNANSNNYIYMAIRRGPTATPTAASSVFAIDQENSSEPYYTSGFPVDMGFIKRLNNTGSWFLGSRLTQGRELVTNLSDGEGGASNNQFDYMDGWGAGSFATDAYSWMWKRAPGYFDVSLYEGDDQSTHDLNHNLGVVPEMIWVKRRDGAADWAVYHKDVYGAGGVDYVLTLNNSAAREDLSIFGTPSSTQFTVKTSIAQVNSNADSYIAFLFATLAGVSKVGSYTGNGGSSVQNIDCGFTSGAKFVLIKCATASRDWMVFDTTRGIVAGNDPELKLNNTDAEVLSTDQIDPLSSGFSIPTSADNHVNDNGETFIFYAIAT